MLDAVAQIQLAGGIVRPAIFFRMESDPMLRLWSGVGDMLADIDNIETEAATYTGAGELRDLPSLQQLINGVAQRVEFSLSGVDETHLALADAEAPAIRGARVNIGLRALDETWAPVTPMIWLWEGEADVLSLDSRLDDDNRVNTITLSTGSAFTGRRRPRLATYTDAAQRARSVDDAFFDRVAKYTSDYTKTWPRY